MINTKEGRVNFEDASTCTLEKKKKQKEDKNQRGLVIKL
jgi:hypothetical protein